MKTRIFFFSHQGLSVYLLRTPAPGKKPILEHILREMLYNSLNLLHGQKGRMLLSETGIGVLLQVCRRAQDIIIAPMQVW